MKTIKIKNLEEYFDQDVLVQGFVENIRNLQYVIFMIIKDETGKVQVTIEKEGNEENTKSDIQNEEESKNVSFFLFKKREQQQKMKELEK